MSRETIKHCVNHPTYAPKCWECWYRAYGVPHPIDTASDDGVQPFRRARAIPQVSIHRSSDAIVLDVIMFAAGVIAVIGFGVWILTGGL